MSHRFLFILLLLPFSYPATCQTLLPNRRCGEEIGVCVRQESTAKACVCQDGRFVVRKSSGLFALTGAKAPDLLLVSQVGAKARLGRVYRARGNSYVQVGEWSGWSIRSGKRRGEQVVFFEELQPTMEHPRKVRYFAWHKDRFKETN